MLFSHIVQSRTAYDTPSDAGAVSKIPNPVSSTDIANVGSFQRVLSVTQCASLAPKNYTSCVHKAMMSYCAMLRGLAVRESEVE